MKHRKVDEWITCDRCEVDQSEHPEMFADQRAEVEIRRFGKPLNPKHGTALVSLQGPTLDLCSPCTAFLIEFLTPGHTLSGSGSGA